MLYIHSTDKVIHLGYLSTQQTRLLEKIKVIHNKSQIRATLNKR